MNPSTGRIPGTPICVDSFNGRLHQDTNFAELLFFCSHAHFDHMTGLKSSWNFGRIYCSAVTKALMHVKCGIPERFITALEVGQSHVIPLRSREQPARKGAGAASSSLHASLSSSAAEETITVTLLDARHCPGAVVFLFQGYFGTVLHTGDFKATPDLIREVQAWVNRVPVDSLYLDNTFCHPRYVFLDQPSAVQRVANLIKLHPGCQAIIGGDSLGKEDFLIELSIALGALIAVSKERLDTIKLLASKGAIVYLPIKAGQPAAKHQSREQASMPSISTKPSRAAELGTGIALQSDALDDELPGLEAVVSDDAIGDDGRAVVLQPEDISRFFSCHNEECFVKVIPKQQVNQASIAFMNTTRPTIGILPSGWACDASFLQAAGALNGASRAIDDFQVDARPSKRLRELEQDACLTLGDLRGAASSMDRELVQSQSIAPPAAVQPSSVSSGSHVPAPMIIDGVTLARPRRSLSDHALNARSRPRVGGVLYRVPFSSHSSYPELEAFVTAVKPRQIVCTVYGNADAAARFAMHLRSGAMQNAVVSPETRVPPSLLRDAPIVGASTGGGMHLDTAPSSDGSSCGSLRVKRDRAEAAWTADTTYRSQQRPRPFQSDHEALPAFASMNAFMSQMARSMMFAPVYQQPRRLNQPAVPISLLDDSEDSSMDASQQPPPLEPDPNLVSSASAGAARAKPESSNMNPQAAACASVHVNLSSSSASTRPIGRVLSSFAEPVKSLKRSRPSETREVALDVRTTAGSATLSVPQNTARSASTPPAATTGDIAVAAEPVCAEVDDLLAELGKRDRNDAVSRASNGGSIAARDSLPGPGPRSNPSVPMATSQAAAGPQKQRDLSVVFKRPQPAKSSRSSQSLSQETLAKLAEFTASVRAKKSLA